MTLTRSHKGVSESVAGSIIALFETGEQKYLYSHTHNSLVQDSYLKKVIAQAIPILHIWALPDWRKLSEKMIIIIIQVLAIGNEDIPGTCVHESGKDIQGKEHLNHLLQGLSELSYVLHQGVKICKNKLNSSESNFTRDNINIIKNQCINDIYRVKNFWGSGSLG